MKVAIDTSFVVAAIDASHPRHADCVAWMARILAGEVEAVCSRHVGLETYNTLTRHRGRVKPSMAGEAIRETLKYIRIVSNGFESLERLLEQAAVRNALGGAVYDLQHVLIAESENVEFVLTLDAEDFRRLWRGREDVRIGV